MSFLYFLPDTQSADRAARDLGIHDTLGPGYSVSADQVKGPENLRGLMLGRAPDDFEGRFLRFDAPAQEWHSCAGGKFWLGFWKDRRPTEADLSRNTGNEGFIAPLSPGERWVVPCDAMFPRYGTPKEGLGETGWDYQILPEFEPLHKETERYRAALPEDGVDTGTVFPEDEMNDLCVQCLALNYHVGRYEVGALRLLTPENKAWIIGALLRDDSNAVPTEAADDAPTKDHHS